MKKISGLILILLSLTFSGWCEDIPKAPELGIVEMLDDTIPADLVFTNEMGEQVKLLEIIDKPTIISLVYFNCPGICSPLLDGVAEVISKSDLVIGKDYQVLTVSFNPSDNYELAVKKKNNYVHQINREIDETGWKWFAGDSINIERLTKTLGFKYIKQGNDYIHAAGIMVVSPKGKITRYLYGTYFLPFDLKMAIAEASRGQSGPSINKILNFCFSYDPDGRKYVFNITRIAASVIMLSALSLLVYLYLTRKKKIKTISK